MLICKMHIIEEKEEARKMIITNWGNSFWCAEKEGKRRKKLKVSTNFNNIHFSWLKVA